MIRTGVFVAAALATALATLPGSVSQAAPAMPAPSRTAAVKAMQVAENGQVDGGGSGESLSSKLNKSGGVIAPKEDVDPAIHVPAPDPHPNSTPVIPPSRGGGGSAK